MRVSNTNVRHIRFNDAEEYLFSVVNEVIDEIRTMMRENECNLMYNTQTGECVTLDEFDRVAGIINGLGAMDEILTE
jgi:hypothetical protein